MSNVQSHAFWLVLLSLIGGAVLSEIPGITMKWPDGNYGLPMPKSGCPSNDWLEGLRYHDSEDHNNGNYASNRSHLAGNVSDHGIEQRFCVHRGDPRSTTEKIRWPRGNYCVYKKGSRCPKGLKQGWVRWDDENSNIDFPNAVRGVVPEGIYGENTLIYFCCSTTGSKSVPIHLPYGPPFYLLAFGSPECQQVHNYQASAEFLQFDDEDEANTNAHSRVAPFGSTEDPYNTRLYYCYYEAVPCESLGHQICLRNSSEHELAASTQEGEISRRPFRRNAAPSHGSAFATGSACGAILFGAAVFAIITKRFLSFYDAALADTRWG